MSTTPSDYIDFEQRGGFAELSARTKLRFTGADRVRYLNGQVTANVNRLALGHALPACVTTAKGKLSADVLISAGTDDLLVDAEPDLREALLARLERYIIADDVAVEDVTDEVALFHLIKVADSAVPTGAGVQMVRSRRFGQDGIDLLVPAAGAEALRAQLSASFAPLNDTMLEMMRIERGVPRWGHELGEDTLPPEAGLDLSHIDYHKGCYIGQEVISRLKSVGHVNRQLVGFMPSDGLDDLTAGMRIFAAAEPARQLGTLTSATRSFALAKPIALGYLKRGSPSDGLIALPASADAPAVAVTVRELPFISS